MKAQRSDGVGGTPDIPGTGGLLLEVTHEWMRVTAHYSGAPRPVPAVMPRRTAAEDMEVDGWVAAVIRVAEEAEAGAGSGHSLFNHPRQGRIRLSAHVVTRMPDQTKVFVSWSEVGRGQAVWEAWQGRRSCPVCLTVAVEATEACAECGTLLDRPIKGMPEVS